MRTSYSFGQHSTDLCTGTLLQLVLDNEGNSTWTGGLGPSETSNAKVAAPSSTVL